MSEKPGTYLQRAFAEFQRVHPDPINARSLAALMRVEIACGYQYVKRLKALGLIRVVANGNPRFPAYELVPGALAPSSDQRGKRRASWASRPISQITDRVARPRRVS